MYVCVKLCLNTYAYHILRYQCTYELITTCILKHVYAHKYACRYMSINMHIYNKSVYICKYIRLHTRHPRSNLTQPHESVRLDRRSRVQVLGQSVWQHIHCHGTPSLVVQILAIISQVKNRALEKKTRRRGIKNGWFWHGLRTMINGPFDRD